jgi:hypothetical protein
MIQIVLSREQVTAIRDAVGGIELLDSEGHPIGIVSTGVTAEDLRIVRERMASNEPGLPLQDLLERLRALRPAADPWQSTP